MSFSSINIGMEAVSGAVLAVLTLLQMSRKNKTWQDKLFILVLLTCLFQTACDTAAWWLSGRPGAAALNAAHIVNFLLNGTAAFSMFFFFLYVYVYASPDDQYSNVQKRPLWIIGGLSVLQFVLCVINLWNGMLYSIDASNRYHWGDWYVLQYMIIWGQLLIVMLVIISWRKSLRKRDVWAFLSFAAFPGLVALLTFWETRLMLHYPATMLSLLLIYATVQKEQEKQLELELADGRTAIMLSQIQPHFLYNSLLAIQDLCNRNPEQAEKTIGAFADYLRGNINSLNLKRPIYFVEELRHVQTYLSLEKIRFEERLEVVFDIGVEDFHIPALTLQPIVENAILHGVMRRVEGGTVIIRTCEDESHYLVTVEDNGVGFDSVTAGREDGQSHIGIENVRYRLKVLSGGVLDIKSIPDVGTTATISIPKGGYCL